MTMKKNRSGLLAAPMILWSMIFVGATILYIIALSFLTRNPDGNGVILKFTLENYQKLADPLYLKVFLNTIVLALETTLLCILIGLPFALIMARTEGKLRSLLLLLVIVPFWTNALVRIYGWRILMMGNGPINNLLLSIGVIEKPLKMMNTRGAVLLGMVYGLLPFMILPVYSSAEKLDRKLLLAARDLGAKPWKAFVTIELKLILPGLLTGCVLVFVPSMALFFISDLLGGTGDILVGNLVRDQLLKSRNWPFAAALAVLLLAMTAIVMFLQRKAGGKNSDLTLM